MNNIKKKLEAGFFFSTWKCRKDLKWLISETWLVLVPKQGRRQETHGNLLLSQIPERQAKVQCSASYAQKKPAYSLPFPSTVRTELQHRPAAGLQSDGRYKEHFRRCHCLSQLKLTHYDVHVVSWHPSCNRIQAVPPLPNTAFYGCCSKKNEGT